MRRLALFVAALGLVIATGGITSADAGKTVRTRGDAILRPNTFVRSDLRFSPGPVTIQSGESVTWTHADETEFPHTVTIATEGQLVKTFSDFALGTCPACDAAGEAARAGHFPGPPPTPPVFELDDGDGEFDDPGDSVLFFQGQSFSKEINAPSGTMLRYFCAIHPWMQGAIRVE